MYTQKFSQVFQGPITNRPGFQYQKQKGQSSYRPQQKIQKEQIIDQSSLKVAQISPSEAALPLSNENPEVSGFDKNQYQNLSYSQQYQKLAEQQDWNLRWNIPKPCKDQQSQEPGAKKIVWSDVFTTQKVNYFLRRWVNTDVMIAAVVGGMHVLCLFAPFTFSWSNVGLMLGLYFITGCIGITMGYHRLFSHRSFKVPKWLEYTIAYCGALAIQGDPMEWVSSHRWHHYHTDDPLDPHSPFEGFWWSHSGWFFDAKTTLKRVGDRSNVSDMATDPFYRHLANWYPLHVALQFVALYLIGGFPAIVWGGAVRLVWVYHITWLVNSAAHCWGYQSYNTGDLSRNNWWVAMLAFGEGWHNNHHAFEYSARHGLGKKEFDSTYMMIKLFEKLGLAKHVRIPTEAAKNKLAIQNS